MVYSYEEYEEYILEDYNDLVGEKMSKGEAIARTFNEYDMLAKKSETDKAMFSIIFSEIALTHEKISHSFMNYIEQSLKELDFKAIKQENSLTIEQLNSLKNRRDYVLQELKKKPLNYYPRVCWYYNELSEEVQKFIDDFIKESERLEAIISNVLQRFDRDCKNTNSEKFIIYTTIAESIYNHQIKDVLGINELKLELESFRIADITDEQLTEEEQEKLSERIKSVLSKLNF